MFRWLEHKIDPALDWVLHWLGEILGEVPKLVTLGVEVLELEPEAWACGNADQCQAAPLSTLATSEFMLSIEDHANSSAVSESQLKENDSIVRRPSDLPPFDDHHGPFIQRSKQRERSTPPQLCVAFLSCGRLNELLWAMSRIVQHLEETEPELDFEIAWVDNGTPGVAQACRHAGMQARRHAGTQACGICT